MKNFLRQDDVNLVESRLKKFEQETGCELLLVVANSSDEYPAAVWRFSFISTLIFTFSFSLFFEFHHSYYWSVLFLVFGIFFLGVGRLPLFKRWSLSEREVERECFEKSVELFHTLGTSKVSHKVTAMIMVSLLEKKIMVLVDEKLKTQITNDELNELIQIMKTEFKKGNQALGFVHSIKKLEEKILKDFGGKVSDIHFSELDDSIHFL